jgi:putative ABC transport system permease protein
MTPQLPRVIRWLVAIVAPSRWRDSLAGDLAEERMRRREKGQAAHMLWLAGAAIASAVRLRVEPTSNVLRTSPSSFISTSAFAVRQAWRTIAARPGFALITVLTLTLGIGANTAVFSLGNWLLFRPIPGVTNANELTTIRLESAAGAVWVMSVPAYREVAALPGLASLGAAANVMFAVNDEGVPTRIDGAMVTSNYFSMLQQHLTLGRGFTASEDEPGNANVAVLSDNLWRRAFGANPAIVGTPVTLSGNLYTVIGIAAKGFRGPDRSGRTDVWVPLASFRAAAPGLPATALTGDTGMFLSFLGRRAPGVSLDEINQQAKVLTSRLAATRPLFKRGVLTARGGIDVPKWQKDGLREMLALLLTVAGLLLMLTCANVANLLFARTHERHAELATRQALGASRAAIVRQLILEGLLLSAAGGVLALAAAKALGAWIEGLVVSRTVPALSSIGIDWRVFAFAAGVSIATCLVAALVPALVGSRVDLVSSLKAVGRGNTSSGRTLRRVLTTVQVGVAVTLLAVGLLLLRSMHARYDVPLGYNTDHVLAFSVMPSSRGYNDEQTRQFYRVALDALSREPGVRSTSIAWIEPFQMIGQGSRLRASDRPDQDAVDGDGNNVSAGFFSTIGARMLAGREFTTAETLSSVPQSAVIVNETMARRLFGRVDIAGRDVVSIEEKPRHLTVVGVVADMRTHQVDAAPVDPAAFQPFGEQWVPSFAAFHLSINAPDAQMIKRVRVVMQRVDAKLPIYDVEMLSTAVDRSMAEERILSGAIAAFAVLAALVAALGLYGVLARGVAERRREFSIRAALGAQPRAVAALVTREAFGMTGAGAMLGIGAALWLSRFLESQLFRVGPHDLLSLGAAAGLALVMALVAVIGPARRAATAGNVNELR